MHINVSEGRNVKVELGYFLISIHSTETPMVRSECDFCSLIILSNGSS